MSLVCRQKLQPCVSAVTARVEQDYVVGDTITNKLRKVVGVPGDHCAFCVGMFPEKMKMVVYLAVIMPQFSL